jgi:CBS domain containing-hemolysin-like protein
MALEDNESFLEIFEKVKKSGFSRIPVFRENIDNVTGVIYSKDMIAYTEEGDGFDWSKLIRKTIFVPENKKISNLLKDFQAKKIHLAIVVDEYGGTSGIVTLEDVLEEIVGDIKDEFDQDSNAYIRISDNEYVFDSSILLSDITKIMDIENDYFDDQKGDADSIGGLVLEITGQMPLFKQKVPYKDFLITIESVGKRNIKRVRLFKSKT